ncbi:efflux RND transporter permease subunit [Vibrio ulleungensis]|uniref:Efflux RND transporter permease subunit n=1 Tax=Vibrio ulleungensis TaxID=2807619 RepID=A0ABS2HF82_9VIBR|nr:efflux RND transporter permease subunit [Vibrio ulleungensis]MBM7036230.1 efflux RND transporter permease subunit [Vibrio ulleungensis]
MTFYSAITNPRLLVLLCGLLCVSGLVAVNDLPRAEDPLISNRFATVTTTYTGASAERVEKLVTEVVENKLSELSEVKTISSTSRPNISIITIELHDEIVEPEPVWTLARNKLRDVQRQLPSQASTPNLDSDRTYAFTTIAALKWRGDSEINPLVLGRYANELATRLRMQPGTEFVDAYGIPQEEINVELNLAEAAALGHSPVTLSGLIANSDTKIASGQLVNSHAVYGIEVDSNLDSAQSIGNIIVHSDQSGHTVELRDIASVRRTMSSPTSELALVDGDTSVLVAARMQPSLRVDHWTNNVQQVIARFEQTLPQEIELEIVFSQQPYTEQRLIDLVQSLLLGLGLVVSVLLVTLGYRAALLVAAALPLTTLLTLSMMKVTGLPINQMSVTGLIVALGIMVDNAIVMVDTIQSYRHKGKGRLEAMRLAIRHLAIPLLGSTLTTVLAFTPIMLMQGATGEFVGAIAATVSFSLVGSYIISHTIIAGLACHFLTGKASSDTWYVNGLRVKALSKSMSRAIQFAVLKPKSAIICVALVSMTGYWSLTQLTEQFFPPSDRDMFEVQLYLPTQTSIEATETVTREVNRLIHQHVGVEQVSWLVGASFPSFYYNLQSSLRDAPYYAQAMVKVVDVEVANHLIPTLQKQLNTEIPEAQILVRKLEQGPPFTAPIELRIYGEDLHQIKLIGEDIRLMLSRLDHVTHTRETLQPGVPDVHIEFDQSTLQLNQWSMSQMSQWLQTTLVGIDSGHVVEGAQSVPIRVRIADGLRQSDEQLGNLILPLTAESEHLGVSLSSISSRTLTSNHGAITRRNGERVNTIEAYLEADTLPQEVQQKVQRALQDIALPASVYIEFGGESAQRNESVNSLVSNIMLVVVLTILVVVMAFNSFRFSLLIFMVAGLAGGLAILSVYVFGYPFGFTVIIAMLGVIGLAINAAIVILAELKATPNAMAGDIDSIVGAVMMCTRHIVSTTITTVGGFMPLILAGGGFWPPFAIAIVGGTVLTSIVSFFFVPAGFVILTRSRVRPDNGPAVNDVLVNN